MTPAGIGRELLRLIPLLALYLTALFLFPEHADDEASYLDLATRLTHGSYVTGDQDALLDTDPTSPDLWFGPGLPAVLAPLVALDAPRIALRLTGPLFLFAAVVLFYVLARRRWSVRTALTASYALGVYPPFWPLIPNLHSEPLAILLMVAAMLGVAIVVNEGTAPAFVLAAGALAGLAVTRVAYGWVLTIVLLACAIWYLVRRRTATPARMCAVVATALIACVPWLAYTYAETDRVYQWGNSGALSLYWMASPYPADTGDWRQADDVFTDPALARHRPFFEGLRGLPLAEQNTEIEHEAIANILEHPVQYAGNVAANASRLFFNVPYSDGPWRPNDLFYALPNAVVLAAIVFSALVLLRRGSTLPPEAAPFALIGGVALTLHLLVSTYPRMLTPIVPIVVWLTTLAIVDVLRERSGGAHEIDASPRPASEKHRPTELETGGELAKDTL